MIDWKLVTRIAGSVSGEGGAGNYGGKDLSPVTRDAEQRVVAYTGLTPSVPLPAPELVSRPEWIAANVASMRPIFDSLEERLGDLEAPTAPTFAAQASAALLARAGRAAAGTLLSAQLGALTGFLSQRVLGQYDMPLLEPDGTARLLLVVPNLVQTAQRLEVDRDDLLRWVAVHEVTHAVQFSSVPWLRGHLAAGLRELLDSLELRVSSSAAPRVPSLESLRELVDGARNGDLITFVIGRERRAIVERLQTTMAIVEGHAEHVMDAVGAEIIPSQPALRAALEQHRSGRSTPLRMIERLLGIELKLRQYREGKRFCDWVVRRGGMAALDRVWASADALPSAAELADPDLWLSRTASALATH